MTRFYIAGVFRRQQEFLQISHQIEALAAGWHCCASWLHTTVERCRRCDGRGWCAACGGSGDQAEALSSASMSAARIDLFDLDLADVVLVFTEAPAALGASRGGRHVELGYAIAKGKRIAVIGPAENIFCHLVDVFDDWREAAVNLDFHCGPSSVAGQALQGPSG